MPILKSLFIDPLIKNSVYEFKTIHSIQDPQRIQTLNDLFASNTQLKNRVHHPTQIIILS